MDTSAVTEHLLSAGFEEDEALHMINGLDEAMRDVATKDDIQRLEDRIGTMQWTVWLGFGLLAVLQTAVAFLLG